MAERKQPCCYSTCDKLAEYEIRCCVEQTTFCCAMHIPDMMTPALVHEVIRLETPGDTRTPTYV